MAASTSDYLVVGSGLAGLTFAIEASKHGSVTVLTKAALTDSNTTYAQGGIAAAVGESDSWELHEEDTLVAGAGLCDKAAVRHLVQRAPESIAWLRSMGAKFDLAATNRLDLGREGGHSRHRIVHHADKTGWEIERALSTMVRQNERITVVEQAFVTRLLVADHRVVGAQAQVSDLGPRCFAARATVIATGGNGQAYSNTTNPRVATGDGVALAHSVGAEIRNMEFQQFHPTALHHAQLKGFLVTEALRGAGATLRNHQGRRFMYDFDRRLELAPRDVVARSITREIQKLDTWCVYLDATHLDAELLETEFPTIWKRLRSLGLEIEKDWIPVSPAQHYSCGGIVTDLTGKSTVPGLYAAGEVTCTGVHGANRLASNSLLEALVFAKDAAEAVRSEPDCPTDHSPEFVKCLREVDAIRIRHKVQSTLSQHLGIFRTDSGMAEAKATLAELSKEAQEGKQAPFSAYAQEAENLLTVGTLVCEAAAARRENVGLHFNADLE